MVTNSAMHRYTVAAQDSVRFAKEPGVMGRLTEAASMALNWSSTSFVLLLRERPPRLLTSRAYTESQHMSLNTHFELLLPPLLGLPLNKASSWASS